MPKSSLPKPKIFISHSAKEPATAKVLDGLIKCLKPQFDVLVDKKRLRSGQDFRAEITSWIHRAHGAVILFSPNALTRPWVKNEASLLSSRNLLAKGKFKLIPVLLSSVTRDDLEVPDLSPMRLSTLHLVRSNSLPVICKQVRAGLNDLVQPKLPSTPFEELLKRIVPILKGVDEEVLLSAAQAMDVDVTNWDDSAEYPELLAVQMLEGGLSSASKAIRELNDFIDAEKTDRLIDLIAPTWVNLQAASCIPRIAINENQLLRRLWVNGGDDHFAKFTAHHFVRRACSRAPDTAWPILLVPSDGGEDEAGRYKRAIGEYLKTKLLRNENATDAEVKELLEGRENLKEPIFVAFHPPGPAPETLVALRAEFPTLTFFILTGIEAANELANLPAEVQFIEPRLQAGEEAAAYKQYITVLSLRVNP